MHPSFHKHGHRPRKRFGQHFLRDSALIAQIIAAIDPQPEDAMLEIGPGQGALSVPLLNSLKHLYAVEIDRDLIERLRQLHPPTQLTIVQHDVLDFDFAALASHLGMPLRIVGNLPYNISSPLLFHLAAYATHLLDLHVMLQKEVAERIVAPPNCSAYGRLSVMMQYCFACQHVLDVPPDAFHPQPKVHSAVLRLTPLTAREADELPVSFDTLSRLVAAAFSQRRKMLRNTLQAFFSPQELLAHSISPTERAESLSVADFVRLARTQETTMHHS